MVTLRLLRAATLHQQGVPAAVCLAPLAQHVAGAGWLHLDDVGTEIAEQLPAERAGDHLAELDDPNSGERSRHADASSTSRRMTAGPCGPRWPGSILCCGDHTGLAAGCRPVAAECTAVTGRPVGRCATCHAADGSVAVGSSCCRPTAASTFGISSPATTVSAAATSTARNTAAPDVGRGDRVGRRASGRRDDPVGDGPEDGGTDRAADGPGEQVRAGGDPALVPRDAGLGGDQRGGGDEAHPQAR